MTIKVGPGSRTQGWTNQDIVLYHGTTAAEAVNIVTGGVKLERCQRGSDFGRGFYTTTSLRQAKRFSMMRARKRRSQSAVVAMNVSRDKVAALDVHAFVVGTPASVDFWTLVEYCRIGAVGHGRTLGPGYYDVVFGPVAKFFQQRVVHTDYDQVSFHTSAAIALLNAAERKVMM